MAREKIKMRKIEKTAARQVTFSKRRRGLFKKAKELAILCDVRLGFIVFSSTGKLFDFSTTSMKDIIEEYNASLEKVHNAGKPSLEIQINSDNSSHKGEIIKVEDFQLSQLMGKDFEGLTLNELVLLEKRFEKELRGVLERKGKKIIEEITGLQQKGAKLMEENDLLREKVINMTEEQRIMDLSESLQISHEHKQSSVSNSTTSYLEGTHDNESADTSLRLGLRFI